MIEVNQAFFEALDFRMVGGEDAATFNAADIDRMATDHGLSKREFFDQIACYLAVRYHAGKLTWELGDLLANNLFVPFLDENLPRPPSLFWDVYDAFDAGEYHRKADRSDDPEAAFTRPMIAKFIEDHGLTEHTRP